MRLFCERDFLNSWKDKVAAFDSNDSINDLRGINLSRQSLHDFVLSGADLRWAEFYNSTLVGPIQGANLSSVDFNLVKFLKVQFLEGVEFLMGYLIMQFLCILVLKNVICNLHHSRT